MALRFSTLQELAPELTPELTLELAPRAELWKPRDLDKRMIEPGPEFKIHELTNIYLSNQTKPDDGQKGGH